MKRRRPCEFNMETVIERILSGESITEVSRDLGVSYQAIYVPLRARGIQGGKKQRDKRPLEEKIKAQLSTNEKGCILWPGRFINFTKDLGSKIECVCFLLGIPTPRYTATATRICGNKHCYNVEHLARERQFDRNEEVRERWALHLKHSTTMEKLAKEYGLTRQRIEQIINNPKVVTK